jgi:hypothetical protein
MDARQRREVQEVQLEDESFEDLPRKWQAALLESEANGRTSSFIEDG